MAIRAAIWCTAALGGLILVPDRSAIASPAAASEGRTCQSELELHRNGAAIEIPVAGRTPAEVTFRVAAGRDYLVVADERGTDVMLDVIAADGSVAVHSDNPVRRNGRQSAIAALAVAGDLHVRVTGKEHDAVTGRVTIGLYDLAALAADEQCMQAWRALAIADASYARGQDVSLGRVLAGTAATRHAYFLAAEEYRVAYALLEASGDEGLRLAAAHALAAVYYQDIQNWGQSAEWATRTAALARAHDRDYEAARAEALLAAAWIELAPTFKPDLATATPGTVHARFDQARALLRKLEQFHRRRGEYYDATLQLNNIGVADVYEARFEDAQREFALASRQFGALHERPRQGLALQNLAVTEWNRGDVVAASGTFRQALERLTPQPYPNLYLMALINSARVNFELGDFDTALRLNARALDFARSIAARLAEARSLYGLGIAYYALGDRGLAAQYLEASLAMRPAGVDASGRVESLLALGTLYGDGGRYRAAVAADEEALGLSATAPGRARMLVRLASDQAATGKTIEALQTLAVVLDGSSGASADARIEAFIARGHVHRLEGRLDDAERDLRTALALIVRHDSPDAQFRTELELALTLRSAHRSSEALTAVDWALARGEELRRQTANPEFRAHLQEPLRPAFDLKLSLLAERYRQFVEQRNPLSAGRVAVAALATAESGRAQSLLDLSSLQFAMRPSDDLRRDLERRERLYRDLAARRYELAELENSSGAADLTAVALRADITKLRLALDTLNTDIARRAAVGGAASAFDPNDLPAWLRRHSSDTVLVEYWLGVEEAYAWTVSRDGIRWTLLGPSKPISDAARSLSAALQNATGKPLRDRQELSAILYDRILRPLGEHAASGRSLIAVPDGALHFVPFAALRTGHASASRYLIEEHDVAITPASRWLMIHRLPRPGARSSSRYLLVSDPIYREDDERLKGQGAGTGTRRIEPEAAGLRRLGELRRLPWTAREAAMVAALLPASQVDQLSGASATRARLLALDWRRYRVIHLASHGILDGGMPQLSALVLSAFDENGAPVEQAVRASDLAALTLNADIVALSACETALGTEVVGEGPVGLASTAMARGAGAVLASLWQTPDEMSARLMTDFYRGMLTRGTGPVAALGAAMRTVLAADREADPAYWAVFQLSVSHLNESTRVPIDGANESI
jgi:CHAT domain-containing protein